jgi:hypothetical protein
MPKPPPAWPADIGGILLRAAQRLGVTVETAARDLSVEDIMDEVDLHAYLFDVDHEPAQPKAPDTRRLPAAFR